MSILVLSPHSDDAELCCGGTINKFSRNGAKVYCAIFSTPDHDSDGKHMDRSVLERESLEASAILNYRIIRFDFKTRTFPENRQKILDEMITLKNDISPTLVITTSSVDDHQDHATIHKESARAFRGIPMICYESPWNNPEFNGNIFVELEREDIDAKMSAINCYKSQTNRHGFPDNELVYGLARLRGIQARKQFAESFAAHFVVL